jgi:hypothetical protein
VSDSLHVRGPSVAPADIGKRGVFRGSDFYYYCGISWGLYRLLIDAMAISQCIGQDLRKVLSRKCPDRVSMIMRCGFATFVGYANAQAPTRCEKMANGVS